MDKILKWCSQMVDVMAVKFSAISLLYGDREMKDRIVWKIQFFQSSKFVLFFFAFSSAVAGFLNVLLVEVKRKRKREGRVSQIISDVSSITRQFYCIIACRMTLVTLIYFITHTNFLPPLFFYSLNKEQEMTQCHWFFFLFRVCTLYLDRRLPEIPVVSNGGI